MKLLQMADQVRYSRMTTQELRETFLLEGLFRPGALDLAYVDLDRTVIGSAVPTAAPLSLETQPELRAEFFCERRELGVLNVGGAGSVTVDGTVFELAKLDCLYIGRGSKAISFTSQDAANPAAFYLLSYPAHAEFPTKMVHFKDLEGLKLGSVETCNKRTIYKAIYKEAQAAVALALYLRAGKAAPSGLLNSSTTDPLNHKTVPAVLLPPVWVTASNMKSTIIADKFVPTKQLCAGTYAADCTKYGI